jgi:peptide deformylase
MIKPIYIFGAPVLRKVAEDITPDYPNLEQLIADMFETMAHSDGIGLAAPQVGLSIRLFVVDCSPLEEDHPELKDFKKVFLNAHIIERSGEVKLYNEGCLSIPGLREDVNRESTILMKYVDENFVSYEEQFDGVVARVIQHEYDHLDGILFPDRLSNIKKQIIKGKLQGISKGRFSANYRYKLAL